MSILVLIYILNFVSNPCTHFFVKFMRQTMARLIVTMRRKLFHGCHGSDPSILFSSTSAARLRGFEEDLHLQGQQFNNILSALYVGYIFMQVPS